MIAALVQISDLKKYYPVRVGFWANHYLRAVDGVSLAIEEGETVGLVGESGSGKSTLGKCVLLLERPSGGAIQIGDENVTAASPGRLRRLRQSMQMVFQDPLGSLNPRLTVGQMVIEPLRIHGLANGQQATKQVAELFGLVGLQPEHMNRYPHQLSGGQQQRVGIARALATRPRFIILDEPTSALDVSIQAQLLGLFKNLQRELKLTYLFISHDLSVVGTLAQRIAVMYLGQIVEIGPAQDVFHRSKHPYTQALISAVPVENPGESKARVYLAGEVSSAIDPPAACRLATRCPFAEERCRDEPQPLVETTPGHFVRCWKWDRLRSSHSPEANGSAPAGYGYTREAAA